MVKEILTYIFSKSTEDKHDLNWLASVTTMKVQLGGYASTARVGVKYPP